MLVTDALLQREPTTLNGLTLRTVNCLYFMQEQHPWAWFCMNLPKPDTVANLLKWHSTTLLAFPNFGPKSLDNLEHVLMQHGLHLTLEKPHHGKPPNQED